MSEEKIIEQRKEKVVNFLKNKFNLVSYLILAIILYINIKIRTLNMPGLKDITTGTWTLGPDLDPFLFLRYAKEIVANNMHLPLMDMMRYIPLGFNTSTETQLLPYSIAYLYKFLHFFSSSVNVDYAAVIFPVIISVFTAIAFYLLVRKIFEDKGNKISSIIALLSTAFMISLPSLLPRTIAGIPEKESLGFALMFFAFYFFVASWKSKNNKNAIILGLLAGLFTGLMGLVWGGVMFVFAAISIAGFISFLMNLVHKKELIAYLSWLIGSIIFWVPLTNRINLQGFLTSPTSGASVIVALVMLIYFGIFKTRLKENKLIRNTFLDKIPAKILSILITIVLVLIISTILFGPGMLFGMIKDVGSHLIQPYSDRFSFTVAENKQPFFAEWKESFGPNIIRYNSIGQEIARYPIFFWLFFIGSIVLFYEMIKTFRKNEKVILTSSYILFLLALVFSRTSQSSILNGESFLSKVFYIGGYLILLASWIYVLYQRYKNKELHEIFKEIKFNYVFIFALSFVGIIAARSGIRFVMVLTPITTIIVSYFAISLLFKAYTYKSKDFRILWMIIAVIVALFTIYSLIGTGINLNKSNASIKVEPGYYLIAKATAGSYIPSSYTQQWQQAMAWVRNSTSKDAVFAHWWDYGYWVQSMGERPTMLDGGNAIVYWDYLMGRYGLTATNESEALELFYSHNVSYFLIDSTDIGKYSAYSSIGSDENYDRYSWIGTYLLDDSQTIEKQNQTMLVYTGGTALDEDLIITEEGKQVLLPKQSAGVGALIVPVINENNSKGFKQPYAIMVYQGKQYQVYLRYLYANGKLKDFGSGINATAYVFPRLDQKDTGFSINQLGAAMYLSPRNMKALWVHLYLLEEGKNFELAHTQQSKIVEELKKQGVEVGDFIYYQGIQGPIKIWKVNYTGKEKVNPEYVQTGFPSDIEKRMEA
jgi:asparagine N-glycosylation enzyme membrane subunit Stt3